MIPLDKDPGVRPIGVVEVCRRIIGKAVMKIVKQDLQEAVGLHQFCVGYEAGCESAVHCMSTVFDTNEAILFVDASNAFNSLNRAVTLRNVRTICPVLAPILINTYRSPADLYANGQILSSQEGTTQGDPLGMAMYAIGTKPLICHLDGLASHQLWYADDSAAGGKLSNLKRWWEKLCEIGPQYGYFPNSSKTHLLVKPDSLHSAESIFSGTDIKVVSGGVEYLGGVIGSASFLEEVIEKKVKIWSEEIERLSIIAESQPHAAYAAFSHGISAKWTYFSRVSDFSRLPSDLQCFAHLENVIRSKFIPALTGSCQPSDLDRNLFALPIRLGGLGLFNPTCPLIDHYSTSASISSPLINCFFYPNIQFDPISCLEEQREIKFSLLSERRKMQVEHADHLRSQLTPSLQHSIDLSREKGASIWLSALPLDSYGFLLHKTAFRDALHLRYGWTIPNTPSHCVCGREFGVEHSLSCPKGGFPSIRHNEIRDITASLLSEVCHNVAVEPHLQPLSGEQMDLLSTNTEVNARLDIAADGVWGGRFERTYFDVRVFNPFAQSNLQSPPAATYRRHELDKTRLYDQRIREIEHSSFTPLIFSSSGGMGKIATTFYKRIAAMLAEKKHSSFSSVMGLIRCRLSFALLRSSIMCIRGARSSRSRPVMDTPFDLQIVESHLSV